MSLRGLKVRGLWDHPQPTGGTHKDPQGTHKNLDLTILLIIVRLACQRPAAQVHATSSLQPRQHREVVVVVVVMI